LLLHPFFRSVILPLAQLVDIMSESGLAANQETHKQLEACFAYNNRLRST